MQPNEAAASLASDLSSSDDALMVFQPEDQDKQFFFGAEFIAGAAVVLLTAFFAGMAEAVKGRTKDWGKSLGEVLCDKLEALFKKGTAAPDAATELDAAMGQAKQAIDASQPGDVESAMHAVRGVIEQSFIDRGASPAKAAMLADQVEAKAIAAMAT